MINTRMVNVQAVEYQLVATMANMLKDIYSNKSSDEYKSKGDITASSEYKTIEQMVSELKTLRGFSKSNADDIRTLFDTLHRPIFKKMVTEYIAKPNDRNTVFTTLYTVGYRVLVGELSRIFASTEATDKGIVYKPDKISKKQSMAILIKSFNSSLEKQIDSHIRSNASETSANKMDSATSDAIQEGVVADVAAVVKSVFQKAPEVINAISTVFTTASSTYNPLALINSVLSSHYDKKVEKFEKMAALYNATKEAYEEYLRIPEAQRKQRIESKYQKNLEKYNIKMNNLRAKIEHYDQRSIADAEEKLNDTKSSTGTKPTTSNDDGNSSSDTDGFDF